MVEVTINGRKLKEFRDALRWTQGQLEYKSGVSQAHISRLERGERRNVEVGTVGKLADALDVSVSDLLTEPTLTDELPPVRIYLQRVYGVDFATANQIGDVVEMLVDGWRLRQGEEQRESA